MARLRLLLRGELRPFMERSGGTLIWIPSLFVTGFGLLAGAMLWLDDALFERGRGLPLLTVTSATADSFLSSVAGATITVTGLTVSITVIAVQLASSQLSPRVMGRFLRDRTQQTTLGLLGGVFTYCLVALGVLPARVALLEGTGVPSVPSATITLALPLAVAALFAIVKFVDHSARSVQAGVLIRSVAEDAIAAVRQVSLTDAERSATRDRASEAEADDGVDVEEGQEGDESVAAPLEDPPDDAVSVVAERLGWVTAIDRDALLSGLPQGATLRLSVRAGLFIGGPQLLAAAWGSDELEEESLQTLLRSALWLDPERQLGEDLTFATRQIVDIALRALSPGINDPTTATEATVHLGAIVGEILEQPNPPRAITGEDGRRLLEPMRLGHADHVHAAFAQLWQAALDHPLVITSVLRTMGLLVDRCRRRGHAHRADPIRDEAQRLVDAFAARQDLDHEVERVRTIAREQRLIDDGDQAR